MQSEDHHHVLNLCIPPDTRETANITKHILFVGRILFHEYSHIIYTRICFSSTPVLIYLLQPTVRKCTAEHLGWNEIAGGVPRSHLSYLFSSLLVDFEPSSKLIYIPKRPCPSSVYTHHVNIIDVRRTLTREFPIPFPYPGLHSKDHEAGCVVMCALPSNTTPQTTYTQRSYNAATYTFMVYSSNSTTHFIYVAHGTISGGHYDNDGDVIIRWLGVLCE